MPVATVSRNVAVAAIEASQKVLALQEEDLLMEALAAVATVSAFAKLADFVASRESELLAGAASAGQAPDRLGSSHAQRGAYGGSVLYCRTAGLQTCCMGTCLCVDSQATATVKESATFVFASQHKIRLSKSSSRLLPYT